MSAPNATPPLTEEFLAESRGPQALAIIIIFPILAIIVVGLRMYTRLCVVHSPSHEDWAIVGAMIFSIACAVCQGMQVKNGMGRHVQAVSFDQVAPSLKALFTSIIFYNFALCLTKISILLQYLRIAIDKPIRLVCWGFFWFTVVYCVETFFAALFQCLPVAKFWDDSIPGKCVNKFALYYANAGINIAQDISLIVLPCFILQRLVLPKREKFSLIVILGLGGFAAIASICRLHALYVLHYSKDVTWDSPGTATWSSMELNTGIVCASLPTLRAFFTKYWPRAFLSSFMGSRRNVSREGTAKGQYYNMEGSVLVKKTIAIGNQGKDVESGNNRTNVSSHNNSLETSIRREETAESQRDLTALPRR